MDGSKEAPAAIQRSKLILERMAIFDKKDAEMQNARVTTVPQSKKSGNADLNKISLSSSAPLEKSASQGSSTEAGLQFLWYEC